MSEERWALITGASSGIGAAFARAYAKRGINIALTARREDRLKQLASELQSTFKVKTHLIVADLANVNAPKLIYASTQGAGIQVDILVNNAGYGVTGHFHHQSWQVHRDFLQVLSTSVCHLTHLYLPSMQKRQFGRIINVASVAGLIIPGAGHTLYGAVKGLVVKFSEALWAENLHTGVHVTASCPGFTYSEFHDVTGSREQMNKLPKFLWYDADAVVEEAIEGSEANRPRVISGRVYRWIVAFIKMIPYRIFSALTRRASERYRVQNLTDA